MEVNFFVKGIILGFSIAAPVGPIGVLCIRKTLQFGRLSGLFSGLGAATADTVYGVVAAFGLTLISSFILAGQFWLQNQEFKEGKSVRFLLFLKDNPESEIIGFCNFSQIFRGPFQACYLGYHIHKDFERKGLISEAVAKAIEYMFEQQKLYRIMANYM